MHILSLFLPNFKVILNNPNLQPQIILRILSTFPGNRDLMIKIGFNHALTRNEPEHDSLIILILLVLSQVIITKNVL